jgi:hypothetical protein
MGTAIAPVTKITKTLPVSACQTPALAARRDGKPVRKSHDRRLAPSDQMSKIKAPSDRSATQRTVSARAWKPRSIQWRRALLVAVPVMRIPRGTVPGATY